MADADAANAPANAAAAAVVLPPPVPQPAVPVPEVEQCLRWIGFKDNKAAMIAGELGDNLVEVANNNSKDIRSMAEAFLSQKVAEGRVVFKLNQRKFKQWRAGAETVSRLAMFRRLTDLTATLSWPPFMIA
jgi:hypothetical protein